MQTYLWISLGAIVGANCRYWLGAWVAKQFGTDFPLGTLLINLSGSLVIGLLMELAVEHFAVEPRLRALLVVGFLGSYTTFSSYAYESVALLMNGQYVQGGLYLLGSSFLGALAVLTGIGLGRLLP